jgi:hypothetical protein
MRVEFKDAIVVGAELEESTSATGAAVRQVRIDFGASIAAKLPTNAPGVKWVSPGVLLTGSVELIGGVQQWNMSKETTGRDNDMAGISLKGLIISRVQAGDDIKEIVPEMVEKDWAASEPTRFRAANAPKPPAGGPGKTGGEGEATETNDEIV